MHKLSKALTFMGAILALTFCAVSCKTDDDDEPTMYTVTVSSSIEHGKVSVDKTSAEAGATIKLTATADEGYELDSYSVKDASANALTVTEGTFTMPASDVTVSATFKEIAVTPQKTAGSISYATATVSKTTDDEPFTNELTKTGDGTVTYASSKTDVAEVNATTGEVTIKGAGEATITATVEDSDTYTYATKTASYTLTVTYIGTKAPSEAKAVGDIVFSDGSATPYSTDLTLSGAQKEAAVAVIYYAGSAEDVLGVKTLGVGLKNTGTDSILAWAKNGGTNITTIQCTPSPEGPGAAATATFSGDLDGSDNWQALCDAVSEEGTSGNYPAWEWVNAYDTTASLTGDYASGWYLPTVAELSMLYRVKDTVNSALEKAGGTKIADAIYWSSSQCASPNYEAWSVWFDVGYLDNDGKAYSRSVCTVRAF